MMKKLVKEWYNKPAVLGLVVIFSSLAVYINSLSGDFIWDDIEQIVDNPVIKEIRNIPSFFTSDLWRLIGNPTIGSYYYRPLFLLSFAVDYNLWGLNPLGYHITNLLLHALSSFLIYLIGRRLFQNSKPAFLGSMLFAVHPVHVESVAWISGRTDPLAAVFFLLSVYLYILFKDGKGLVVLFLSLTAYFFSLLSKEIAITLPLLLLVYELSFKPPPVNTIEPLAKVSEHPLPLVTGEGQGGGESPILQALESSPTPSPPPVKGGGKRFARCSIYNKIKSMQIIGIYLLISVAYLYIRALVLGEAIGQSSSFPPIHKRIYTSFGIILDYIRIIILPVNLKVLYDTPLRESFFDLRVIFPMLLLAVVFISTLLTYWKDKTVFFTAVWFFITILPVSNIVPLKPTMMAERLVYIPSIGTCLLGGLISYRICQKKYPLSIFSKAFMLILFSILSMTAFQRNHLWANETVYFARSVKDAPENAYAHHNLGEAYRKAGYIDRATTEWQTALEIYPLHPESNNSLANIALMQGDYSDAVRKYLIALKGRPGNPESHYNLAMALERLGNIEEAISHYREFIKTASPKHQDLIEQVTARLRLFDRGIYQK